MYDVDDTCTNLSPYLMYDDDVIPYVIPSNDNSSPSMPPTLFHDNMSSSALPSPPASFSKVPSSAETARYRRTSMTVPSK